MGPHRPGPGPRRRCAAWRPAVGPGGARAAGEADALHEPVRRPAARRALRQTDADLAERPAGRDRRHRPAARAACGCAARDRPAATTACATIIATPRAPTSSTGCGSASGGPARAAATTCWPPSGRTSATSPPRWSPLGADAAERWLRDGIDEAMNAFNGLDLATPTRDHRHPFASIAPAHAPSRGGDRRVAALVDALRPPSAATGRPSRARRRAEPRTWPPAAQSAGLAGRWSSSPAPTTRPTAWPTTSPPGCRRRSVRVLPERAALPLERALPEHDESAERLRVLAGLGVAAAERSCVVAPLLALRAAHARRPSSWRARAPASGSGERIGQRTLLERLVAAGYDAERRGHRRRRVRAPRRPRRRLAARRGGDRCGIELFGDEVESIRGFDPMTQASRRRLERGRPPAGSRVPARRWLGRAAGACAAPPDRPAAGGRCAHLAQGDLAEAAETWAALPDRRARRRPRAGAAHARPHRRRRAVARWRPTSTRQAADRRDGLVGRRRAATRLAAPVRRARPRSTDLVERAAESLDEQAGADAGYAAAPLLPGPAPIAPGAWLDGAGARPPRGRQHRPGQPRRRAARRSGPADCGRWRSCASAPAAGAHRPGPRLAVAAVRPRAERAAWS